MASIKALLSFRLCVSIAVVHSSDLVTVTPHIEGQPTTAAKN
jgi:hypothetical protein